MNKKFVELVVALLISGVTTVAYSATVDYALLTEGATIYAISSQYVTNQTAKDNLLRFTRIAWLSNGETGFIFSDGDLNQWIKVDLGQVRSIDEIGAYVSNSDREVWDFFQIRTSLDNIDFALWGGVGVKDGLTDITTPLNLIDSPKDQSVRYIEYQFGEHSYDWGNGGSRVFTLYARDNFNPVPLPATISLFGTGLAGLAGTRLKRKKK